MLKGTSDIFVNYSLRRNTSLFKNSHIFLDSLYDHEQQSKVRDWRSKTVIYDVICTTWNSSTGYE